MKKILILAALVLASVSTLAFTATQYQRLGNVDISSSTARGGFGLWQVTAARIAALTPTVAGQLVYCSDCAYARVCISTGTENAAWVAVSSGPISRCN